jgi:hypothetical protein
MIREAIDRILALAPVEKIEFDGREFASKKIEPIAPSHPAPLKIGTLAGVVDWIKNEGKEFYGKSGAPGVAIHIGGPASVSVISDLDWFWMERHTYLVAAAQACAFPFGQYMEIENFIINLQLHFVDTAAKAEILKYVSHISKNEVMTATDDGISQTTVAKNEIGRLEKVSLAPIQKLQPFRTFREVAQPEGEFLLRLKSGGGDLPLVALYSATGVAWELEAVANVHGYLKGELPDVAVIR